MTGAIMQQFYYTSCPEGQSVDGMTGYGVRASSCPNIPVKGGISAYLQYPICNVGVGEKTPPVRYAYLQCLDGSRFIVHSTYIPSEHSWDKRPNCFTHVIFEFDQTEVSPQCALELWQNDFWLTHYDGESNLLPKVEPHDLCQTESTSSECKLSKHEVFVASQLIAAWLSPSVTGTIFIDDHPEVVVAAISNLVKCIPGHLLTSLTFSNYEITPIVTNASIVGAWKCTADFAKRIKSDSLWIKADAEGKLDVSTQEDIYAERILGILQSNNGEDVRDFLNNWTSGTEQNGESLLARFLLRFAPDDLQESHITNCLSTIGGAQNVIESDSVLSNIILDAADGKHSGWEHYTKILDQASDSNKPGMLDTVSQKVTCVLVESILEGNINRVNAMFDAILPQIHTSSTDRRVCLKQILECLSAEDAQSISTDVRFNIIKHINDWKLFSELNEKLIEAWLTTHNDDEFACLLQMQPPGGLVASAFSKYLMRVEVLSSAIADEVSSQPDLIASGLISLFRHSSSIDVSCLLSAVFRHPGYCVEDVVDCLLEMNGKLCDFPYVQKQIVAVAKNPQSRRKHILHPEIIEYLKENREEFRQLVSQLIADRDSNVLQNQDFLIAAYHTGVLEESWKSKSVAVAAWALEQMPAAIVKIFVSHTSIDKAKHLLTKSRIKQLQLQLFKHCLMRGRELPALPEKIRGATLIEMLKIAFEVPIEMSQVQELLQDGLCRIPNEQEDGIEDKLLSLADEQAQLWGLVDTWLCFQLDRDHHDLPLKFYDVASDAKSHIDLSLEQRICTRLVTDVLFRYNRSHSSAPYPHLLRTFYCRFLNEKRYRNCTTEQHLLKLWSFIHEKQYDDIDAIRSIATSVSFLISEKRLNRSDQSQLMDKMLPELLNACLDCESSFLLTRQLDAVVLFYQVPIDTSQVLEIDAYATMCQDLLSKSSRAMIKVWAAIIHGAFRRFSKRNDSAWNNLAEQLLYSYLDEEGKRLPQEAPHLKAMPPHKTDKMHIVSPVGLSLLRCTELWDDLEYGLLLEALSKSYEASREEDQRKYDSKQPKRKKWRLF